MNSSRSVLTPVRREFFGLLLLIIIVLASRLPFIMHGLDEWDTANFALSVTRFDVLNHQPHPPGQYVYVRLMQGINALTGNELFTLSFASAVCSSLALVPYYFALRQIFRPVVAAGALILTAFTFGFWITSLRMVSDPVATLFVYGVVCALLAGLINQRWFLFGMALCGIALGVKQTALYFLAPFAVVVNLVVLHRKGARYPLLGIFAFLFTVAAWLRPTVQNCHGWGNYIDACRSMQLENYDVESIIFHLSREALQNQWHHNMLQPWGAVALAVAMLALAAFGLIVCCRRGTAGLLFSLFGLGVMIYAFCFLYRFNKYYVYYLPIYNAFAAAALFSLGELLASRLQRPVLRLMVPGLAIALITAVNLSLTVPLLSKVSHFRAPPQAALEALRKRPGVGPKPLLLTDDTATSHELDYFRVKQKVDLLIVHKHLSKAAAALSSGRKVYLLSSSAFRPAADQLTAIRLIGRYVWPPEMYDILQGRPDLRQLMLYEATAPLPETYSFGADVFPPPLLQKGMWEDGWCGPSSEFLLPCHETAADLLHIRLTAPEEFGYHYPYRLLYRFAEGRPAALIVKQPGCSDFVVSLPQQIGARAVEMQLLAPQTVQPAQHDVHSTDVRELSVHLDELECVSESHPLSIYRAEGWYDPEMEENIETRWTKDHADLSALIYRAGTLVLEGSLLSYTNDNAVEISVDDRKVQIIPLPGTGWNAVAWRLPMTAGLHRITLRSRNPGVQPPGDARALALRVRNLQTRLEHD